VTDSEIIGQVKGLCVARKYDEAIAMTNTISNQRAAVEAHLLCIEHEQAWLKSAPQPGEK
jgi:hypothetical protein